MEKDSNEWCSLWKLSCPAKIKIFIWQLCHDKLPVRDNLYSKGMDIDDICSICEQGIESCNHLFRGCNGALQVWNIVFHKWKIKVDDVETNLHWVLKYNNMFKKLKGGVSILFPFILWELWLHRNDLYFNNVKFQPDNVVHRAETKANEYWQVVEQKGGESVDEILIPWVAPDSNFIKLNVDGAVNNNGIAGIGGVLRNASGQHIASFSKCIGYNGSVDAELRAVREGMIVAKEMGVRNLMVESDSETAIRFCERKTCDVWRLEVVLSDIVNLEKFFVNVSYGHTYREGNSVADMLAKKATSSGSCNVWRGRPPQYICNFLYDDARGRVFPRVVKL